MTPGRTLSWIFFAVAMLAPAGCSNLRTNQPSGAACVRSVECAPGLACVSGMCSSDLSSLAEAGTLPPLDLGAGDGGSVPVTDLGTPAMDMSVPAMDMAMPAVDMGTPDVDMGAADLGTPDVDMGAADLGTPDVDMGAVDPDMGTVDAGV